MPVGSLLLDASSLCSLLGTSDASWLLMCCVLSPLWDEGAVVLAGLSACGAALPLCAALASCALGEDECVLLLLRDGEAGG